ncbi:hypothetical protein PIB30_087541, partial [Stylosanthes scabra]|nr:hypothetical protein [Stylosanthes scabra]
MDFVHLQHTIGDIASIAADNAVLRNLFIYRMDEIEKRTQEAERVLHFENSSSMQIDGASSHRSPTLVIKVRYVDFAVSLLPDLTDEGIDALYHAIKPALMDVEGLIQKKAYNAFSVILKHYSPPPSGGRNFHTGAPIDAPFAATRSSHHPLRFYPTFE